MKDKKERKRHSRAQEVWRLFKKNKAAMFGLVLFLIIFILICMADVITPYKTAVSVNVREKLMHPCSAHLLGTDRYGRDLLSRILHGGRISLLIGFSTSLLSMVAGCLLGGIAGYRGGRTDEIIMRVLDVFSAIPTILLALAIIASLGASLTNLILALTISRIPGFARIVRSAVLGIANQEFIEAAKVGGASEWRIMTRHILRNCVGQIIVQATLNMSSMILLAASLSFLGLGVNPPTPEWGSIISEAREFLRTEPYLFIFPAVFLILTSLSVSLIGDGLRDSLDPRLRS